MKKIFLIALLLLSVLTSVKNVEAVIYYPDSVSFNSDAKFIGGTAEPIFIKLSDNIVPDQKISYDIGISREIKQGKITQFQVLSSNIVSLNKMKENKWSYNLEIPNPIDGAVNDTYVIYVRSYAPNNPDSENLVISRSFQIKTVNETPSASLVGGSVLLSNGEEYGFKTGPVIYKNPESEIFATSSKLVLDIVSNTDITLNPKIVFKKLRSTVFEREIDVGALAIAPGKNTKVIDLPTFDYEPGVYLGVITFNTDKQVGLVDQVEFQYIVDGPIVTVGQVIYQSEVEDNYILAMPTFGKPVDYTTPGQEINFATVTASSTTSQVYKTVVMYRASNGKVIFTTEENIDYSKQYHELSAPKSKIKNAKTISIEVFDGEKIFFETTQDLNLPVPARDATGILCGIIILLLGVALYMMTRKKKILVFTIAMSVLCASTYIFAVDWTPSPNNADFMDNNHTVYATFNRNFSTEYVSCDIGGTDVLVKLQITTCTNSFDRVFVGFSTVSMADAKNQQSEVVYYGTASTTVPGHNKVHRYNLNYIKIGNLRGPIAANSKMYVRLAIDVYEVRACQTRVDPGAACKGYAEYVVNLPVTPTTGAGSCDRCTNLVGEQSVPLFAARGRDYFYVSEGDGSLYFSPSSQTLPGACTLDMCADTDANETDIPVGFEWKGSGTAYEQYTCVQPTTETCSCVGRNRVCMNGAVQTSNAPDASCNLSAVCTYPQLTQAGSITFTYTATNVIGTLIGGGSITRTYDTSVATTVVDTRTLSDSADGQTSTATCSQSFSPIIIGGDPSDPVCTVGPCPPVTREIVSFTSSKIVDKGNDCVFSWSTTGFDQCRMSGELTALNGTSSFNTSDNRNITKTLACSYGGVSYPSRTATCLVRPAVNEE